MRIKTITLVILLFLLASSASLGYLDLFGIQRVTADKSIFDDHYGLDDILEYSLLQEAPILSTIDNPDGDGDYLVDWSDVADAIGYTLEEADNDQFTSPLLRYVGVDSQCQVIGQHFGTWYYRVLASNAGGDSAWSNTVSVIVDHAPPGAPTLFPFSSPNKNGHYLVDWSDASGASAYELQEDVNSAFISPTIRYAGTNSQYQINGQAEGTWYYQVQASNAYGDSPWSNTESVVVVRKTPTPTQTNTATSTPTATQTNTATVTQTPTQTNTGTVTQTSTQTNTATSTPTPTLTSTSTITQTPTNTIPPTPSPTKTSTPTPSPIPTNGSIFLPIVYKPIPNGVHVLPISFYYVSRNTMFIVGEVLNNTSDSLTWVKVTVNFYEASGHLAGTGHTYMWPLDLPAWEKGCFSISMEVPPNWSYYQFEAPTYNLSGTSSGLTIFNDSGLYNYANGDYDIIGRVRNDGNQRSTSVRVGGTLYNVSGVPVGCNYAYVNSTPLDPGQISSFAINFWGYYRYYNDVTYYRLRVAGDLP
jgi:hypothetical protein